MAYQVLIVDDDPDIREVLSLMLTKNHYETVKAMNAQEAIRILKEKPELDLVILDIMMPEMDGITACRQIRSFSRIPALFLTAKTQEADKQEAYDNGGDDYLGKPFMENELLRKVQALIRRYRIYQKKEEESPARDKPFVIDTWNRCVVKNEQKIPVTEKEYGILQYFMSHRGKPIDPKTLYEAVWQEEYLPSSTNTVMVHIMNLRKKLEDDPSQPTLIRTVWGKGYQIDEE